jgi:hypothetical protein
MFCLLVYICLRGELGIKKSKKENLFYEMKLNIL